MVYCQSNGSNAIDRIWNTSYYPIIIGFGGGCYIYEVYVTKIFLESYILEQTTTLKNNFKINTDLTGAKDFDGTGIEYCVETKFDFNGLRYKYCRQIEKLLGDEKAQKIIEKYGSNGTCTTRNHEYNIGGITGAGNNDAKGTEGCIEIEFHAIGIGYKYSQIDYDCTEIKCDNMI